MPPPMHFRPFLRTGLCQAVAMAAFLMFLAFMQAHRPFALTRPGAAAVNPKASVFVSFAQEPLPPERKPSDTPSAEPDVQRPPRPPERFRPSSSRASEASETIQLPPGSARRPGSGETVRVPPEELPLSYLMKFQSMEEFHSFLDKLPEEQDADAPAMSLIRIEGLPQTVSGMTALFESYRMHPFLFNPDRFNYLITSDLRLLTGKEAIERYVSAVGRYLREDEPNSAYAAIRDGLVERARRSAAIRKVITEETEFDRMQLGLASAYLTRFFRRLERDTARQVGELTGKRVEVRDLARIDCRARPSRFGTRVDAASRPSGRMGPPALFVWPRCPLCCPDKGLNSCCGGPIIRCREASARRTV